MSVQGIPLDPTIVAALVSIAVSSAISLIVVFYVEPQRWRKDQRMRNIQERLKYAYEPLHAIIFPKILNSSSVEADRLLKSEQDKIHEIFRTLLHLIEKDTWEEYSRIFSPRTVLGEVRIGNFDRDEKESILRASCTTTGFTSTA